MDRCAPGRASWSPPRRSTNLTIQATRLPPIGDQTRNYRFAAPTPNLQAVPAQPRQSTSRSPVETLHGHRRDPCCALPGPAPHPIPVASRQLRARHHNQRDNQIPIALAAARRPNLPATSCPGAFWTPAAGARGAARDAGVQKPAHYRHSNYLRPPHSCGR